MTAFAEQQFVSVVITASSGLRSGSGEIARGVRPNQRHVGTAIREQEEGRLMFPTCKHITAVQTAPQENEVSHG